MVVSGNKLSFNIVLFIVLFSGICEAQTPGGVSTNLQAWLKADDGPRTSGVSSTDGQATDTWVDKSGARFTYAFI